MLLSSKLTTVKSILKFTYNDSRKIKWWLTDQTLTAVARSIIEVIESIADNTIPPNIRLFKHNDRKVVFRVKHPDNKEQSYVAKVFFLNRLEHRLKYHRYGLDEAANLITAAARAVNTPKVYGYGHINSLFGLVKANIIILEDLDKLSPIGKLMRTRPADEHHALLMRTIPLFVTLYDAGCNHIDVNAQAIMLCEHGFNSDVFLLDFQHARFYNTSSIEILMFETGYFARSCKKWLLPEMIDEWLDKILVAIGISDPTDKQKMKERFNYYHTTELSRKQRKAITG